MGFTELFRDARERDGYWIEDAIISFTSQLYALMLKRQMSKTDLARKAGVSQPYITRVLKGTDNLTIATMVKLVRAVGARIRIVIQEDAKEAELLSSGHHEDVTEEWLGSEAPLPYRVDHLSSAKTVTQADWGVQ